MKFKYLFISLIYLLFSSFSQGSDIKPIIDGDKNSKINLIIYESMTCPSCANFHQNIFPDLKKEFIDTGKVNIEFRNFPLDLAALNASKLAHCKNDGRSDILHYLYNGQKKWAKGKNILEVNNNIKKIFENTSYNIDFEKCINNKEIEDFILEERISGHKLYNIEGTPTLVINGKKFGKKLNYKNLKKTLKKML